MVRTWTELLESRSGFESPCIPHPRHRMAKRTTETEGGRGHSSGHQLKRLAQERGRDATEAAGVSGPKLPLHGVLVGCLEADMLRNMQVEPLTGP